MKIKMFALLLFMFLFVSRNALSCEVFIRRARTASIFEFVIGPQTTFGQLKGAASKAFKVPLGSFVLFTTKGQFSDSAVVLDSGLDRSQIRLIDLPCAAATKEEETRAAE